MNKYVVFLVVCSLFYSRFCQAEKLVFRPINFSHALPLDKEIDSTLKAAVYEYNMGKLSKHKVLNDSFYDLYLFISTRRLNNKYLLQEVSKKTYALWKLLDTYNQKDYGNLHKLSLVLMDRIVKTKEYISYTSPEFIVDALRKMVWSPLFLMGLVIQGLMLFYFISPVRFLLALRVVAPLSMRAFIRVRILGFLGLIVSGLVAAGLEFGAFFTKLSQTHVNPFPRRWSFYDSNGGEVPDTIFLFAQGMQVGGPRRKETFIKHKIVSKYVIDFDFPSMDKYAANFKIDFSQTIDIECIKLAIEYLFLQKKYRKKKIIMVGISRGASGILNFLVRYPTVNVKGLVLESPFSSLHGILKSFVDKIHIPGASFFAWLLHQIFSLIFPLYRQDGVSVLRAIQKIRIPAFIIHSQADFMVSEAMVTSLAQSFMQYNKDAYYALFRNGAHGEILACCGSGIYSSIVNAFYKKHRLPYDDSMIKEGEDFSSYRQPDNIIVCS